MYNNIQNYSVKLAYFILLGFMSNVTWRSARHKTFNFWHFVHHTNQLFLIFHITISGVRIAIIRLLCYLLFELLNELLVSRGCKWYSDYQWTSVLTIGVLTTILESIIIMIMEKNSQIYRKIRLTQSVPDIWLNFIEVSKNTNMNLLWFKYVEK
jgi:hypothetical protein